MNRADQIEGRNQLLLSPDHDGSCPCTTIREIRYLACKRFLWCNRYGEWGSGSSTEKFAPGASSFGDGLIIHSHIA
ncbi:hypothetical protein M404DRAFT_1006426 [Pisolithus tinctorius Marx 270]|uniref:Uncharacterized protein n=1 Tax=Pisolithus tinctorius Marx 270 TaxID=870435 RepID=A0A0C3JH52_PISTI|nr:hypothetical protein M404DRAFT_1006426 [Pisolithus tinctorius Marx 270]